uniref:Zinc finger, CCHC-type n=1 Tax=Tanacetum cinerariifolium TaxID=118510 RepID=A0A6L2K3Q8_TANCI|nr:zinc finger, CCHC-type [Tanacetum cinerariifolium]
MGDKNPIRTLGDYFKPRHEGYKNTIELLEENNVVPLRSDTIRLVQNGCSFHGLRSEDPNQHLKYFLKLVDSLDLNGDKRERTRLCLFQFSLRDQASNWLKRLPAGSISTLEDLTTRLVSNFMAFQDARLSKFEADFKQQQSEMTKKIDTVLKAITDRIIGALPSNTVKNLNLNVNYTTLVLSTCSYPTDDPQCLTRIYCLIKAITIYPKQPSKPHDDKSEVEEREERRNPKNIDTTPPSPPNPLISFIKEKVRKLNSFLESSGLVPQSPDIEFVCTKGDNEDVMFIEIIRKYDGSHKEGPEDKGNAKIKGLEVGYFDTFSTRSELAYHKLSQVVLGKPYVEISNMTHDPPKGVVRFTNETDEIAYKMPYKIEQYNLLPDLEKEHTKSVYLKNEEDKIRGVKYTMSKILGFYKECLELKPEYLTGVADEEEVT